ncbi:MAG: GAF domain-containing protein [Chloroflexi bacterium]|nr:GAF domain-containing protein [Chloroflexota bacterium]
MKRTRNLANRLTSSFTLAVFIPLLTVSLIFGWSFIRFSSQSIQVRQKSIIEIGRSYVDRYFNSLLEEMTLMASLTSRQNDSWASATEEVCRHSNEHYASFAVLDKNGNEFARLDDCNRVGENSLQSRASEEAFFRALRGELFVGNISFNEANEPVATISFLTQSQNKQEAVVIARVALGNIWQPLNELEIGDGGYIYVVDRRGNLVGYRDPELVKQAQSLASLPSIAPLLINQTGVSAASYTGLLNEDVIGSSILIENLNWGLVLEQPTSQVYASRNQFGILILVILVVFIVGAVIVSRNTAHTIVTPIQQLAHGAEAIANEDFSVTIKVDTQDEIGLTANAFNKMTGRLRELVGSLEERVTARTKDLATVAEMGTISSAILETSRLLQTVVDLTKDRFNLYHSHVYLLDDTGENLVLTAGAGEPGRIMSAEKRSIPVSREQSLVARAARERRGVIVNDVTQSPDFLPNPLLPDTRAELAVPMLVGETLVGVFDIQSDIVGRFTESDANIQTTLAAQLASSVQNARSFERSKEQAELETLVNTISQKIQRATTVEDTLQTAIRELGLALGASRVQGHIQADRQDTGISSQN